MLKPCDNTPLKSCSCGNTLSPVSTITGDGALETHSENYVNLYEHGHALPGSDLGPNTYNFQPSPYPAAEPSSYFSARQQAFRASTPASRYAAYNKYNSMRGTPIQTPDSEDLRKQRKKMLYRKIIITAAPIILFFIGVLIVVLAQNGHIPVGDHATFDSDSATGNP